MANRAQKILEQESKATKGRIFGAPVVWPSPRLHKTAADKRRERELIDAGLLPPTQRDFEDAGLLPLNPARERKLLRDVGLLPPPVRRKIWE